MLLSSFILVSLFVISAAADNDSKPADAAKTYDEDRKDVVQERSVGSGDKQETEYAPDEKEEYNLSAEEQESPIDAASTYSAMVIEPGQQRSMIYKTTNSRQSKRYSKSSRQAAGSNYKPYRSSNLIDNQRPPSVESNIPAVHPSVMRNLLKQEPQTFTDSQQSQADVNDKGPSNWQVTTNSNADNRFGTVKIGYNLQRDHAGQKGTYDIRKNPIYVPNKVSVQNPSSDSSFNVGYSIGFGNGQPQSVRGHVIDAPANLRQGKAFSFPTSYQNTPVNIHFNGGDTFWKHMGSGVEISQSVDVNQKPYNSYISEPVSDDHKHQPSDAVPPQSSFGNDDLQQVFDDYSIPSRFRFDHNYALQQSNPFDFSNAIDPMTNKPYTEEKLNEMTKETHISLGEPFTKSFLKSFPDTMSFSYFESSPRQSKPSHVELNRETSPETISQLHTNNGSRQGRFSTYKHEMQEYERPLSDTPVTIQNTVTYHPKPVPIDFSKSLSSSAKAVLPPSYPLKATSTGNTPHMIATNYGGNLGYPRFPITPHMFTPAGKIPPAGMIQAILVPVNAPVTPPFSYPVGVPLVGSGYSPYWGHPIGMVRIPEPMGTQPAFHGGSELQNLEPEEHSSVESYPAKQVHSHYNIVQHTNEHPVEPSQFHVQKTVYPLRADGNHYLKLKKVFPTEIPAFATSPGVTYTSSSYPQTVSTKTHPPRIQTPSMIIVKRS